MTFSTRRAALVGALAVGIAVLAGCNSGDKAAPQATTADAAYDGTIHPEQWPAVEWPLAEDPALEKRVNDLLASSKLLLLAFEYRERLRLSVEACRRRLGLLQHFVSLLA